MIVGQGRKVTSQVPIERLQMYKMPPQEKISLEDFEQFAIDRLKLLREVEMLGIRYKKDSSEYSTHMYSAVKTMFKFYKTNDEKSKQQQPQNKIKDTQKDNISHFILRLAYCRSDELRRWFIAQEVDLFKFRFSIEAEQFNNIEAFLAKNNLNYTTIPAKEKMNKRSKLAASNYKMIESLVESTDFYKVPFTEVLDLVRTRKVYLEKGYAYVPKDSLVSIISNCFRIHLSHELALTARSLPYLEEDERLLPRLTNLSRQYLGQEYDSKKSLPGGKISLGQIDTLAKTSYPLCMRQLHDALRKDHHLKHWGRMQYGLFIKGLGLTLEEALMFWRSEFTRIMEVDKFDKQYAYNVRHCYGKEGKRVDYTPYSCMKIILTNHPGQGDHHGCPFRHSDPDILRQKLVGYNVPKPAINEIQSLVKDSHYQLACARYFEVTHKTTLSHPDTVAHPNKYVIESRLVHEKQSSGALKQEPLANTSIDHVHPGTGIKTEQVLPSNGNYGTSSNDNPGTGIKTEQVLPSNGNYGTSSNDNDIEMEDLDQNALKSVSDLGY